MVVRYHLSAILERGRALKKQSLCWARKIQAPELARVESNSGEAASESPKIPTQYVSRERVEAEEYRSGDPLSKYWSHVQSIWDVMVNSANDTDRMSEQERILRILGRRTPGESGDPDGP